MNGLEIAVAAWNAVVLLLYGYDKLKSKGNGRRVPERTLLLSGFLFGAVGALCGMYLFRHKTKHRYFWVWNTLFLVLQGAGLLFYLFRS